MIKHIKYKHKIETLRYKSYSEVEHAMDTLSDNGWEVFQVTDGEYNDYWQYNVVYLYCRMPL